MERGVLPCIAARGAPSVRSGRLIDVLAPATEVLDQAADVDQDMVLQLRVLIDALAPDV
ncbi:hypothetical protein [Streptomyces milbemycinicus]|uniref:hypothetical protein n=1 Tax=Streptomyces milbemycinicus TaxID=476552 RepID=UPI0034010B49